jgi:hypothetical protein
MFLSILVGKMSPKFAKNLGRLAKAFTIKPPWPARTEGQMEGPLAG